MLRFRNVLLIDDDADDQELFTEALATIDDAAKIYTASDGIAALDMLERIHPPEPDLIFLDLNMPRKNGLEFLREMKQQEKFQDIPVIVYSTSANYREEMASLGAVHYMVKQNSFKTLCNDLGFVLSQQWA